MAGRGFGKTRTGAEWSREKVMYQGSRVMNFIGPTAADVRDVMVEGPAGFLKVCEPYGWNPKYEPSKRRITCPNGAVIHLFSAEEPERLRGPQCYDFWADEIGAWKNAKYVWDMAMMGLRMGDEPQALATTTPRPTELVKELVADEWSPEHQSGRVAITGGNTYENAKNLARTFIANIRRKYEGTRLGEQELEGKLLLDMPGALWSATLLEQFRILLRDDDMDPVLRDLDLYRIVVGVDPMGGDPNDETQMDNPSETGIVVVGLGPHDEAYVLDDLSIAGTPNEWGTHVVRAFRRWRADKIVAEANNGGQMVKSTILTVDPSAPVSLVHASRGKITRAEPVSSLYEQGRVHHVGVFPRLEEQMTSYTGKPKEKSPDRMDALVWAVWELMVKNQVAGSLDANTMEAFDYTISA
jgi:phage terminase large subunit-like protein